MFVSTSLLTRECNAGSPCDAQFSNHKHNSTVLYSVCSTNGMNDRVTNSTGAWLMQSWSDSRSTFSPRPVQDCQETCREVCIATVERSALPLILCISIVCPLVSLMILPLYIIWERQRAHEKFISLPMFNLLMAIYHVHLGSVDRTNPLIQV